MAKKPMIRYIVDKLKDAETQDEKQIVLERYGSDTLLQRVLYFTYHPMIIFGLDDFTPSKMGVEDGMGISKFLHIPEDLSENKLDDTEAKFACSLVFTHINELEAEIFLGILKKDIGVDLEVKTINRVFPKLIPSYPVQYPTPYTDELAQKIDFPCVVQPYVNGDRINIIVRYNLVEFRDKTGKVLTGYQEYVREFSDLAQNQSTVFDAVVFFDNVTQRKKFVLFDVVRYDGFLKGTDNRVMYNWRFNGLDYMYSLCVTPEMSPSYMVVPSQVVNNWREVKLAKMKIKSDVIVKNLESEWMSGPNPLHLRVGIKQKTINSEFRPKDTTV